MWDRHVVAIVFKYVFIFLFGSKNLGPFLPWLSSYSYAKHKTFCHWSQDIRVLNLLLVCFTTKIVVQTFQKCALLTR